MEKKRREYYKVKGWDIEEVEEMGRKGIEGEKIVRKEKRRQEKERWERIGESRFNRWYSWVKGKKVPHYLRKRWNEKR